MVNELDRERITIQLGREPRGLKEVVCYNKKGWPRVLRVSPMVDGVPFPSHYWLCCQDLKKEIDRLEAVGWIKKIESEYMNDEDFKNKVRVDHENYIKDRLNFLKEDGLIDNIDSKFIESLKKRGVGGIQDFGRIRCLHMHYAHHLAKENTIGKLMDELFQLNKI